MFALIEREIPDDGYWKALAGDDEDHDDLVAAVQQLTSEVTTGKPRSQKQRKLNKPKLSPQRISAIAEKINQGKIDLPSLDLPSDEDWVAVWALVDSGSSVHVVDAKKTFPGLKIDAPPSGHQGFNVANGVRIPHNGFVQTQARTAEGHEYNIRWRNSDVAMPILSTHELARNKNTLEYDEDEGWIKNKITGDKTHFIQREGVYFVKLMFPKSQAEPPSKTFGRPG